MGLFNRGERAMPITVKFREISPGDTASVRDLWSRRDLGDFRGSFTTEVPRHGVALIRVKLLSQAIGGHPAEMPAGIVLPKGCVNVPIKVHGAERP